MSVTRYRKRPIEVDTVQWTGDNLNELINFTGGDFLLTTPGEFDDTAITAKVYDSLHDTWVGVKTGQRIVQGVKGETYPIDLDVLAETYEAAPDASGFFRPGRTYAHDVYRFRCEFVATHPVNGHRYAWGWFGREGRGWRHYTFSEWQFQAREWTDVIEAVTA
ncbi:hypothetical protein [Streptomyces sp. NPDC005303]|uniref:hypothetical protein n=1 Tax=Streptomyces sp. NPDC005303 TaxID=3155713 RepID=UPI0033BCE0ED